MTTTRFVSLAAGMAAFTAASWLSSTPAQATTILCGYLSTSIPVAAAAAVAATATTPATPAHPAGTAITGVFYKTQTEQSGYKTKCSQAESTIKGKLPPLPPGSSWVSENKSPCSDFSDVFYSKYSYYAGTPPKPANKAVCDSVSVGHSVQAETDVFPAVPAGWNWKSPLPAGYSITTTYTPK